MQEFPSYQYLKSKELVTLSLDEYQQMISKIYNMLQRIKLLKYFVYTIICILKYYNGGAKIDGILLGVAIIFETHNSDDEEYFLRDLNFLSDKKFGVEKISLISKQLDNTLVSESIQEYIKGDLITIFYLLFLSGDYNSDDMINYILSLKPDNYESEMKQLLKISINEDNNLKINNDVFDKSGNIMFDAKTFLRFINLDKIDANYTENSIIPSLSSKKNFYARQDESELFQQFCENFWNYEGEFLGEGEFGQVNRVNEQTLFDYFGTKDLVVKKLSKEEMFCENKNFVIGSKDDDPKIIKNAFVCLGGMGEYFAGKLTERFNSVNFIDIFAYKSCKDNEFIFMEYIHGNLKDLLNEISDKEQIIILYLQVLHALWCMHQNQMMHNDSHRENIFYIKVDKNTKVKVNNEHRLLNEFDYATYDFGNGHVYNIPISKIKYIIKLGDFGLACKYSEPYLLNPKIKKYPYLDYFCPFYDLNLAFVEVRYSPSSYTIFNDMIKCYLLEIDSYVENNDYDKLYEWFSNRTVESTSDENTVKRLLKYKEIDLERMVRSAVYRSAENFEEYRGERNFNVKDMKNKKHLTIDDLITKNFFISTMKDLGFDKDVTGNKCLFGGPGSK